MPRNDERLLRSELLFGTDNFERLQAAHVTVFGIGGVGSYTVESLARTGVGAITIVDFDEVCITNTNRQIHALTDNFGKDKVLVMKERLEQINPELKVTAIKTYLNQENVTDLIQKEKTDFVIDAIDSIKAKLVLITRCQDEGLSFACSAGAAARIDPTKVEIRNIWDTENDRLAKIIRKRLRKDKRYGKFPVVCSSEYPSMPAKLDSGYNQIIPAVGEEDARYLTLGSISFVTGVFGFFLASLAVNTIIGEPVKKMYTKK